MGEGAEWGRVDQRRRSGSVFWVLRAWLPGRNALAQGRVLHVTRQTWQPPWPELAWGVARLYQLTKSQKCID